MYRYGRSTEAEHQFKVCTLGNHATTTREDGSPNGRSSRWLRGEGGEGDSSGLGVAGGGAEFKQRNKWGRWRETSRTALFLRHQPIGATRSRPRCGIPVLVSSRASFMLTGFRGIFRSSVTPFSACGRHRAPVLDGGAQVDGRADASALAGASCPQVRTGLLLLHTFGDVISFRCNLELDD